jgi:hypothetical protein
LDPDLKYMEHARGLYKTIGNENPAEQEVLGLAVNIQNDMTAAEHKLVNLLAYFKKRKAISLARSRDKEGFTEHLKAHVDDYDHRMETALHHFNQAWFQKMMDLGLAKK